MIVCKFGGSSVADAEHIKKAAQILTSEPSRVVAVVSAPGKRDKRDRKVTDMLYGCDELVRKGESCKTLFALIKKRYLDIVDDLGLPEDVLSGELEEIEQQIAGGAGPDYTASRGEFLCAKLVASYLGWTFLDAQELVVITDDGMVAEETYDRIAKAIHPGQRYVLPGFYGSMRDGTIKTFSRGGSDISGAIAARAVGASLYENWTDVSGIFMADPRIIPDARVIKRMTYQEVRELAAIGFSVFHEEAIAPVREAGIPIQVKNTNRPQDPGTSIVLARESNEDPIIGVTAKSGYVRITVHKLFLFKQQSLYARMEQTLKTLGVVPEFVLFGIDSLVWYFPISQISDGLISTLPSLLKSEFHLDQVACETGFAVAAVTGEALMKTQRVAKSLWPALSEKSVDVQFINYGASLITCFIGIPEHQAKNAVIALYDALIR